ncbi:MAG: ABC transporter permease, partial [Verrucomicrobia bacterium]|nr:ABC transporter permease [Verrucomicrobiota bacterium]
TPDFATQFRVVLERRLRLFLRDRAGLALQAALVLGFPCLVVIFALRGLPQIRNLSLEGELNVIEQLRESAAYLAQAVDVGGLVSGLLLFQIILLALMGANNAALEIAGERQLFESEKLAGLSPAAYLGAKTLFLAGLVTVQAVWMAAFVRWVCAFPGDFFGQVALLWLADAAVTAVCLAFSSWARSAQQASLVSIYFVGFQLPLSGAVLALPENLALVTRPFIAAYWSWAGAVGTLRDTRFYDLVLTITKTELSALPACVWVLAAHIALGLLVAWLGCRRTENK